jgi:hypothetical protein
MFQHEGMTSLSRAVLHDHVTAALLDGRNKEIFSRDKNNLIPSGLREIQLFFHPTW